MERSRSQILLLLFLVGSSILVGGCASSMVAPDLLLDATKNPLPLVGNRVTIDVRMAPSLRRHGMIGSSVKESLELALLEANIFGADSSRPYRMNIEVLVASQSPMSFGSFGNKLKINYVLHDDDDVLIADELVYTEAGSDRWYFSGYARAQRARAVNIAKNVLQFVSTLQNKLYK